MKLPGRRLLETAMKPATQIKTAEDEATVKPRNQGEVTEKEAALNPENHGEAAEKEAAAEEEETQERAKAVRDLDDVKTGLLGGQTSYDWGGGVFD